MTIDLERQDIGLIIIGFLASLVMGWWGTTIAPPTAFQYEWYTAIPLVPFSLITAYFLWRFQEVWGGEMGRYLSIIGIGTIISMLFIVAHVRWHVVGKGFAELPAWGVSVDFWLIFFHFGAATLFLLVAYGAHLLHESQE